MDVLLYLFKLQETNGSLYKHCYSFVHLHEHADNNQAWFKHVGVS